MKPLNNILTESLLDDPESLVKKSDNSVYIKKIKQLIYKSGNINDYDHCYDFFGHEINVGDRVLYCNSDHEYIVEIVSNIKKSRNDIYWLTIDSREVASWEVILIPSNKLKDFYEIIKL